MSRFGGQFPHAGTTIATFAKPAFYVVLVLLHKKLVYSLACVSAAAILRPPTSFGLLRPPRPLWGDAVAGWNNLLLEFVFHGTSISWWLLPLPL